MQPRAHRPDRAADDVGDLLVAIFLDVGEDHDLPLLEGEALPSALDIRSLSCRSDQFLDRLDRPAAAFASESLRGIVLGDLFLITSFSPPKFIPVKIRDDPVDPRKEGGAGLEAAPGPVDANEGLLGQVARIGLVVREPQGIVVGRLAVLVDRALEERRLLGARAGRTACAARPSLGFYAGRAPQHPPDDASRRRSRRS